MAWAKHDGEWEWEPDEILHDPVPPVEGPVVRIVDGVGIFGRHFSPSVDTGTRPWPAKPANDTTNPKDLIGDQKPNLALVPSALTIYAARAYEIGAAKYGAYNWRKKKVRMMVYIAALLRHANCLLDGEDVDGEGNPHVGAMLACLGIIADAKETGNLIDDRPTPGAASRLLAARKIA